MPPAKAGRFTPLVVGDGIGRAPAHFDVSRARIWDELAALIPGGVGSQSDRLCAEAVVDLVHRLRSGDATAAHLTCLRGYLGHFGLTPSSRTTLEMANPSSEDGFDF